MTNSPAQYNTNNQLIINTQTDEIIITRDKLENILLKHSENLKVKYSWSTPFSILITCLVTFLTTDFKARFGFSSATWSAIFVIVLLLSGLWLLHSLYAVCRSWGKGDIDYLIDQIAKKEIEKNMKRNKPTVSVNYAQNGNSTRPNEMGMRVMQNDPKKLKKKV